MGSRYHWDGEALTRTQAHIMNHVSEKLAQKVEHVSAPAIPMPLVAVTVALKGIVLRIRKLGVYNDWIEII